jgi:hypothetical protein
VPAGAALALLVVWQFLQHEAQPPTPAAQSLIAAASALEIGGQMARTVPAAVVAPLSHELHQLNRDLDKTAEYLLASVP